MKNKTVLLLILLLLPLLVMAQRVDIVNPVPSSSGNYTVLKSIGNTVTLGTAGSAGSVNMGAVTFRGSAAINAVGTTKMNSLAVFNSGGETTINKLTSTSTLSVGDDKASVSAGDETNARVSFNNIDPNTNVSIDAQNSTVYDGVFKVTGKTNAGTLKLDGKAFPNAGYGSLTSNTVLVDNLLGSGGDMKWETYESVNTTTGVTDSSKILVFKPTGVTPPNDGDEDPDCAAARDNGTLLSWCKATTAQGAKCEIKIDYTAPTDFLTAASAGGTHKVNTQDMTAGTQAVEKFGSLCLPLGKTQGSAPTNAGTTTYAIADKVLATGKTAEQLFGLSNTTTQVTMADIWFKTTKTLWAQSNVEDANRLPDRGFVWWYGAANTLWPAQYVIQETWSGLDADPYGTSQMFIRVIFSNTSNGHQFDYVDFKKVLARNGTSPLEFEYMLPVDTYTRYSADQVVKLGNPEGTIASNGSFKTFELSAAMDVLIGAGYNSNAGVFINKTNKTAPWNGAAGESCGSLMYIFVPFADQGVKRAAFGLFSESYGSDSKFVRNDYTATLQCKKL